MNRTVAATYGHGCRQSTCPRWARPEATPSPEPRPRERSQAEGSSDSSPARSCRGVQQRAPTPSVSRARRHAPSSVAEGHTPNSSFEALLAAARRGDDPAWARLYGQLAGPLLGYLRGQGANDPEDLVGEVFLDVVRGLPRFDGDEAGFRAWVFTIAHRRLTDQRRTRGRRRTDPVDTADLEAAMPAVSLEPDVIGRLTTEAVVTLLRTLTDDQREVLLLRLVGGLTTVEVAHLTGRDPEAVKGLAKRGLAQLRRRLTPPTSDPEADRAAAAPDPTTRPMTEER